MARRPPRAAAVGLLAVAAAGMLGATSAPSDPDGSPLSPALVAAIVLVVVAGFAAGVLAFGLDGGGSPSGGAGAAEAGCVDRPLAYGLSDRSSVYGRLPAVEREPIPRAGFSTAATAPTADELLHAGVHGFAVIRYRPSDPGVGELRRLIARKVPGFAVIAVPGVHPRMAVTATIWGRELGCRAIDAGGLRAIERLVDDLHGVQ